METTFTEKTTGKATDPRASIADALTELEKAKQAAAAADARVAKAKAALKKTRNKVALIIGEWILDCLKEKNAATLAAIRDLNAAHKMDEKDYIAIDPWLKAMKLTFPATKEPIQTPIQPQKPTATTATMATKIQPQTTIQQTIENRPIPKAAS